MISPPCLFRILTFLYFFCVRSAISIGAGGIGVPIGKADQAQCANNFFSVFGSPLLLAEYKEDDCVRFASPIFIPITY